MNGVAWMKLGSFAKVEKRRNKLQKDYTPYSITQSGLIPTKEYFKEKTNITSKNTSNYFIVHKDWFVYSPSRVDVGSLNYLRVDGPVIVSPIDVVFSIDTNLCLPQYLFYYLKSQYGMKQIMDNREGVEGMGRKNLPFERFSNIKIPIIPIDIQQAIVNQLDTFTTLISRLESELELRQKQYEHYREELLNFEGDEEVEWKTLGDTIEVQRGCRLTKKELLDNGLYPVYHGGIQPIGYYKDSNRSANTTMIINVGASAGTVGFCDKDFWSSDGCFCLSHNPLYNQKFLFYYLKNRERSISQKVRVAGIPTLDSLVLENLKLPVLDIILQQQIVEKLDAFEQLIAALKREIALRQKQYEYYREKLLTFE